MPAGPPPTMQQVVEWVWFGIRWLDAGEGEEFQKSADLIRARPGGRARVGGPAPLLAL